MFNQQETNPHFRDRSSDRQHGQTPFLHSPRNQRPNKQQQQQQHGSTGDHFPVHQPPQQQNGSTGDHFPIHQAPQQQQQQHGPTSDQFPGNQDRVVGTGDRPRRRETGDRRHSSLSTVRPQTTSPMTWLLGIFCALLWIILVLGGLIVLIVYLLFRPKSPRFEVSNASLNAAYLDMGYLLNADLTLLTNFTNPNRKVNIDFSYMIIDLYYQGNRIATRYIDPFSIRRGESMFANVHMVTSQVRLSVESSQMLMRQMESGRVDLEVKGLFRTRSRLGGFLHYSYYLYGHCSIVVSGPPSGVLLSRHCVTKR